MTYWRSVIQLRNESTQEGRRELVLNGVKGRRGNWLLLFILVGVTGYVALMALVSVMIWLLP